MEPLLIWEVLRSATTGAAKGAGQAVGLALVAQTMRPNERARLCSAVAAAIVHVRRELYVDGGYAQPKMSLWHVVHRTKTMSRQVAGALSDARRRMAVKGIIVSLDMQSLSNSPHTFSAPAPRAKIGSDAPKTTPIANPDRRELSSKSSNELTKKQFGGSNNSNVAPKKWGDKRLGKTRVQRWWGRIPGLGRFATRHIERKELGSGAKSSFATPDGSNAGRSHSETVDDARKQPHAIDVAQSPGHHHGESPVDLSQLAEPWLRSVVQWLLVLIVRSEKSPYQLETLTKNGAPTALLNLPDPLPTELEDVDEELRGALRWLTVVFTMLAAAIVTDPALARTLAKLQADQRDFQATAALAQSALAARAAARTAKAALVAAVALVVCAGALSVGALAAAVLVLR